MSMPVIAASADLFRGIAVGDRVAFALAETPDALLVVSLERLSPWAARLPRQPDLHEGDAVVRGQRGLVAAQALVAEVVALDPGHRYRAGRRRVEDVALQLPVELLALVAVRLLRGALDQLVGPGVRPL